eukprot:XP_001698150.1 predicted protein [Chlamydomonas reinhardtii]
MGGATAAAHFRGVRRAALLQALYDRLPPDVVCFDTGVEEVLGEQGAASTGGGGGGVTVRLADGRTVRGSCLVGADGVRSAVARHLQLPAANSYYWYTCFNADEAAAEAPPATPEARQAVALAAVKGWAWSVEECIRRTPPEDITWSRISDRWTAGAFGRGVVTLAGDAAHPMTPNLGQGGCVALEDAVVLGRSLGQLAAAAGQRAGSYRPTLQQPTGQAAAAPPAAGAVAAALRAYEAERSRRCLPLTVRSNLMGQALQIPLAPVVAVRNAFVKAAFQPGHFLDHTAYDCGRLQQ